MRFGNAITDNDTRRGAMFMALIIRELLEGDVTVREIAENIGAHVVTVRRYVSALYAAKCVYVSSWPEDSLGRAGNNIRAYTLGNKPDAKRPAKKTSAQQKRQEATKRKQMRIQNALAGILNNAQRKKQTVEASHC